MQTTSSRHKTQLTHWLVPRDCEIILFTFDAAANPQARLIVTMAKKTAKKHAEIDKLCLRAVKLDSQINFFNFSQASPRQDSVKKM